MPVVVTSKSRNRSKKLERDAALIEKSLKRYTLTAEAESKSRKQGLEDLKFSIGTGQWDESVAADRIDHNRACLSVARKLCRRAHHILRDLGDQALAPGGLNACPEPEAIRAAA